MPLLFPLQKETVVRPVRRLTYFQLRIHKLLGGGTRETTNLKPLLVAIFFLIYFYRTGVNAPLAPLLIPHSSGTHKPDDFTFLSDLSPRVYLVH